MTVVLGGRKYYYSDGVYYHHQDRSYVVVPPPGALEVASKSASYNKDTEAWVTVHIPNRKGEGYTSIALKRSDNGYIGPQGEFYQELPSAEQLRPLYGK